MSAQRDLSDIAPPHPLRLLQGLLRYAVPIDGPDHEEEWLEAHGYLKAIKLRNGGSTYQATVRGMSAFLTAACFIAVESGYIGSNVSESSSSQGKT